MPLWSCTIRRSFSSAKSENHIRNSSAAPSIFFKVSATSSIDHRNTFEHSSPKTRQTPSLSCPQWFHTSVTATDRFSFGIVFLPFSQYSVPSHSFKGDGDNFFLSWAVGFTVESYRTSQIMRSFGGFFSWSLASNIWVKYSHTSRATSCSSGAMTKG